MTKELHVTWLQFHDLPHFGMPGHRIIHPLQQHWMLVTDMKQERETTHTMVLSENATCMQI